MSACHTCHCHRLSVGGYMRAHSQWTRDADKSNCGHRLQCWPNTIMTAIFYHRSSECIHSLLYNSQIHIDQGDSQATQDVE